MTYEFERQHRLPFNEFANDLEWQRDMLKDTAITVKSSPSGTKQSKLGTSIPEEVQTSRYGSNLRPKIKPQRPES